MALLFGTTLRILDAYKLERIQSTFAAVCNHHFSKLPYYTSAGALQSLKLHTLREKASPGCTVFTYFSVGSICYRLLCDKTSWIWVPARNVREFLLLRTGCLCHDCPPARCASAANVFKSSIYLDNKPCFLIAFRFSFCASYVLNVKSMCKWKCIN